MPDPLDPPPLTATSCIVLGLLARAGEATPYELKQLAGATVGNFWSVPHSQLYAEPERLAGLGLLAVRQEADGRRRKRYTLTDAGRDAFAAWLAEPADDLPELRDPGLLQLVMGADPRMVAAARLPAHERQLARYEARKQALEAGDGPVGPRLTLEAGLAHEREWVRFWSQLAVPD